MDIKEHTSSSSHSYKAALITGIITFIIIGGVFTYGGYQYLDLKERRDVLKTRANNLKSNLETARKNIEDLQNKNESLESQLEKAKEKVAALTERVENVTGALSGVTNTIEDIEKLKKLDPELLKKYSKVYFLNENYQPTDLDKIDEEYVYNQSEEEYFHGKATDFLEDLLEEAEDDDITLKIVSAYRSFDHQRRLKDGYTVTYGENTANQFSAEQGYSEHQLGTAVDFTTKGLSGGLNGFGNTAAFQWLTKNAYKYGFVLSYPQNNQYYQYEPWHWRFVGEELSAELHEEDQYFYDMPQDEIDEYLIEIFD